jgi:ketosteroid isomerase-like protein
MSLENVERFRRTTDAYNARDIETFIAYHDPSVEFHSSFAGIGGVYHGHEGLRQWHRDLEEAWGGDIRSEPEAYFDLGEYTLMFSVLRGRGRHSGMEVATQDALVVRWRDGLVVYMKAYASKEEALSDLGLSEDELEPIDP